jgi:type IV secretion/conjugal transfer VirB4 family ATPase
LYKWKNLLAEDGQPPFLPVDTSRGFTEDLMISVFDHQRVPNRLADVLPWFGIVGDNPCIVRLKDGGLLSMLRFAPPDLDASTASELVAHAAQLNNVLSRFGSGWGLHIEHAKRRVRDYPPATWPSAASAAADAERRAYFLHTPHYTMEHTLTLVWRPMAVLESRFARLLTTGTRNGSTVDQDVEAFQDQVRQFTHLLTPCMAWVQPLGPEGTLTALHATVSTDPHRIAVPDVPAYLDCGLCDRDFVPGMEPALLMGLKPQHGKATQRWQERYVAHHLRTLTLTGFPNATYPGILEALSSLPMELRYVIRWLPLDQADAYGLMKQRLNIWQQTKLTIKQRVLQKFIQSDQPLEPDREALLQHGDVAEAMDASAGGAVRFGYCTATVTTWDEDAAQAMANVQGVDDAITSKGFACHIEHLNATEAWLGSLPGELYKNVRRPMLHSLNVAQAMLGGVYTGPERDEHLDAAPLLLADTSGTLTYRLVLHEHGVGHALIIGPTGAGKTTLVGVLASQWQRYHTLGARVRLVDKKGGLAPITAAMGGEQYTLGGEDGGVTFQPLRDIDTLAEREWAQGWVEGLCEGQRVRCTPAQRQELWDALCGMAALPVALRTLSGLARLVQDAEMRVALGPYTMAGAYGRVLDTVAEPLALQAWSCFETDRLWETPGLVAPVLGVLFHQLGRGFAEQKPTLLVLDEAWRYLAHMTFREKIEEWARELRKQQVSLVFSTQDVGELVNSPIASVILSSCPVRIYLPNKRALEPKIMEGYEQMGLQARQIELIATAQSHRDYFVMTGEGARMVNLALGDVQLSLLTKGVLPGG